MDNKATSVDIIETAGKSYFLVWGERDYLIKLAMAPLLIKLVCDITVFSLGWQLDFIKQSLVMLPGYMAEGWMLSHFVRLIFLNHRWPYQPTGDMDKDIAVLAERGRGILSGMVLYALTKMFLAGIASFSYQNMTEEAAAPSDPSTGLFILSVVMMIFSVWAFRFLWLFIPAAVNYGLRDYLKNIGGFLISLQMIAVWLICFLPVFFGFGILAAVIHDLFVAISPSAGGFALSIIRVFVDTLIALFVTAGIALTIGGVIKRNVSAA